MSNFLTIVIPKDLSEKSHHDLLKDLDGCHPIVFACEEGDEEELPYPKTYSKRSRARQLNKACENIDSKFIWFLHADTLIKKSSIVKLEESLKLRSECIHYFNLKFFDHNFLMRINEFGLKLRSDIFKMPFGDQGLVISNDLYKKLGGYREDLLYGEDHDLVWRARIAGAELFNLEETLYTSARKYVKNGWGNTSLKHLSLTYKQAFPLYMEYLKNFYR